MSATAARAIVCAALATAIFTATISIANREKAPRCDLPRVEPDYRCAGLAFSGGAR